MPFIPPPFLVLIAGYLLGSISFALLLARAKGINLREIGSGNLGATNAGRALGKKGAIAVYLLDALKGFVIPFICLNHSVFQEFRGHELPEHWKWWCASAAGFGAWAGHVWPIWHRFKGGKGVATLSGAFLAIDPIAILLAAAVLFVVSKLSKVMALGSIALGFSLPIFVWALERDLLPFLIGNDSEAAHPRQSVLTFAMLAAVLTLWTHRSNIRRLLDGEEHKIGGNS